MNLKTFYQMDTTKSISKKYLLFDFFFCSLFRIQEQLRRIKRNQEKEKVAPVKKKKKKETPMLKVK